MSSCLAQFADCCCCIVCLTRCVVRDREYCLSFGDFLTHTASLRLLSSCHFVCDGLFFFFKQKPAYDWRISDWSSDVGSSDLFFSGKSADDLALARPDFAEAYGIGLQLNTRATAIDREARTVTTATGEVVPYDQLILATGSFPFVPPIPGRERPGCFVYRTIEDLEAMRTAADAGAKVGVVVGGGLRGLEAGKAPKDLGLATPVAAFAPRLLAGQEIGGAWRWERVW